MAHSFFTPQQVAQSTLAALRYSTTLARIVSQDFSKEFAPGRGAAVTVKRPALIGPARRYTAENRAAGDAITYTDVAEPYTSVALSTQVYQAVKLPDDVATFHLEDLERQLIAPMASSVADDLDASVAEALLSVPQGLTAADSADKGKFVGADGVAYDTVTEAAEAGTTIEAIGVKATVKAAALTGANDRSKALKAITAAHQLLTQRGVPLADRFLVVGAGWEAALLDHPLLTQVNTSGSPSVLRDATVGRIKGFTVVVSYLVGEFDCFAMHRDAITLATRVPAPPRGASFVATISAEGYSLRHLWDYDVDHLQDRAVIDTFAGAEVLDPQRIVRLQGAAGIENEPAPAPAPAG